MTRRERPITSFRRRLRRLIDERFEGRYTRLARRAGMPISTLQHTTHEARRLPGGDHLLRMAAALDVSVHYLASGEGVPDAAANPSPASPGARARRGWPARTVLTLPVLSCTCPSACPLPDEVPHRPSARDPRNWGRTLGTASGQHHLIVVRVTPTCPASGWRPETRLIVAMGVHPPTWETLALIHADGHCRWGHVKPVGDALFFAEDAEGDFRVLPAGAWRILGTAIAVVAPL